MPKPITGKGGNYCDWLRQIDIHFPGNGKKLSLLHIREEVLTEHVGLTARKNEVNKERQSIM